MDIFVWIIKDERYWADMSKKGNRIDNQLFYFLSLFASTV